MLTKPTGCLLSLFSEHKKEGLVPDTFPGVLKVDANMEGRPLLNPEYRDFGTNGNQEFEYFVKYLLSEISPKRTQYKRRGCCNKTLSKAFTTSDEAYGLMILDNELDVWNRQIELKNAKESISPKELKCRKKYTDLYQKKQCGWKDIGMYYYRLLCREVEKVREDKGMFEENYLTKFRADVGYDTTSSVSQDDEDETKKLKRLLADLPEHKEDELIENELMDVCIRAI